MKYFFFAVLLIFSLSVYAEPSQDPKDKCRVDMVWPLHEAYKMYKRGVPPPIIEFLSWTDKSLGGAGRWIITTTVSYLEIANLTEEQFVAEGLLLCEKPPKYWALPERSPWTAKWLDI
jgi:hypothetical protein